MQSHKYSEGEGTGCKKSTQERYLIQFGESEVGFLKEETPL